MNESLLQELERLANPAPSDVQDYDETDDVTSARLVDKSKLDNFEAEDETATVSHRKHPRWLAETDERYRGSRITRSKLLKQFSDEESNDDGDEHAQRKRSELALEFFDDEAEDDDEEENDDDEEGYEEDDDEEMEDEEQISDDSVEDEEAIGENVATEEMKDEETGGIDLMAPPKTDIEDDAAKGQVVSAQIKTWEQLVGARIHFQRVIPLINQMPQKKSCWTELLESTQSQDTLKECVKLLKATLDDLLDTHDHFAKSAKKPVNEDDDEITSSSDNDDGEPETSKTSNLESGKRPKPKTIEEYSERINECYSASEQLRVDAINKWYEKTRLATGRINDMAAFETNALSQIKQIMADQDRLIKRTQLKRTAYSVFGKESADDYDEEIFDDDDFYQNLLRELIEKRTTNVDDSVELSRKWLEIQNLKPKTKKKRVVDTRASKGRKCRYDPIPKLVNFMAPVDKCSMNDEARNELFQSLFRVATY